MGLKRRRVMGASQPSKGVVAVVVVAPVVVTSAEGKRDGIAWCRNHGIEPSPTLVVPTPATVENDYAMLLPPRSDREAPSARREAGWVAPSSILG